MLQDLRNEKINGILYSFDLDGFGYPVRCDKDHRIDEWVNSETGVHTFHCAKCQKKFVEIKKEEEEV